MVRHDNQLLAGVLGVLDDKLRRVVHLRAVRNDHIRIFHVLHHRGEVRKHLLVGFQRHGRSRRADVDLDALAQRQEVVVVLDEDSGFRLKLTFHRDHFGVARRHQSIGIGDFPRIRDVFRRSRNRQRLVRVRIGILEQIHLELVLQDAVAGFIAAFFRNQTLLECFFDARTGRRTAVAVALVVAGERADLIQTVVDNHGVAFGDRQAQHVDAVHRHARGVAVALIAPVGDDDALKAERLAQVIHGFLIVVHMDGVGQTGIVAVGHDPLRIRGQGDFPRLHPVVHRLRITARIRKGGVAAARDEVLHARFHAALDLQGEGFFLRHRAGVFRVFAVPAAQLLSVGMQDDMDADRAAFQRVRCPQLLGQLQVIRRAERIMRHVNHAAPRVVFAVIGNDNRDAQTAVLRQRLHRIVVHNLLRGRAVGVVQMAGDVQHVDVVPHRARRERRAFIRHDAFRPEHVARIRKVNAHRVAAGVHMVEKSRSSRVIWS